MSESARKLSYKGYFSYDRGSHGSSYYFVHLADVNTDQQRLVFLDGQPLEIINDGHSFKCLHPGDLKVHAGHEAVDPQAIPGMQTTAAIWQNYRAEITGVDRVAGRTVQRVKLTPNDEHRYPFIFYVDTETGLMLKMVVLDAMGQLLERFRYVMIDYGHVTAADLKPDISGYVAVEHAQGTESQAKDDQASPGWQLAWIPPGFEQEKRQMQGWYRPGQVADTLMFSDGLTVFSVFIEPAQTPVVTDGLKRIGSTSVAIHPVMHNGQNFQVTVIGEIPVQTARQIAMSIRPIP